MQKNDEYMMLNIIEMCASIQVHLARVSHQLVLWNKSGLVDIDSGFCTGSSIMPHKKNPDVLELIRGNSARAIGDVTEVFSLLKSLPLKSYNDQIYNKMIENIKITSQVLKIYSKMIKTLKIPCLKKSV